MGCNITRIEILDGIYQALQNYLGTDVTVTLIPLYNSGVMTSANTAITMAVTPDLFGTHLVYTSLALTPFLSLYLFLCAKNGSSEVRFVYAWNIGAQWYIGAPYLSLIVLKPLPILVLMSQENITKQVKGRNPVAAIQTAFESIMFGIPGLPGLPGNPELPGIPLKNEMFAWTRSVASDDNFQVYKTADGIGERQSEIQTFYWNAGGIMTLPVTLTENQAQGGRFNFIQFPN